MRWIPIAFLGLVALVFFGLSVQVSRGEGRPVLIIHGWAPSGGDQADWDAAYGALAAHLDAAGFDVHGPLMVATGNTAGDTVINAEHVQAYIAANGLTDVVLVGHSLGGYVTEYYVRLLDAGEIGAYALLDSSVNTGGANWLTCWLNPPDQCTGSAVRNAIYGAAARTDLSSLNVKAQYGGTSPAPTCNISISAEHTAMVSHPTTKTAVERLARGENPCAAASTPTATSTLAPTSTAIPSTSTASPAPSSTPSPVPTSTASPTLSPIATATPTPPPSCLWWQRLWGWC